MNHTKIISSVASISYDELPILDDVPAQSSLPPTHIISEETHETSEQVHSIIQVSLSNVIALMEQNLAHELKKVAS